jgi:hypothetical protein
MKAFKNKLVIIFFLLMSLFYANTAKAQVFYIGVNAGVVNSWFDSPDFGEMVSSNGWGWDLGFFLRYGKRPYFQAGFDWTRSANDFVVKVNDDYIIDEIVEFHNFDFSLKVGYNIIQTPMFKFKMHTGPFIGKSVMFSNDDKDLFSNDDFKNPQWGIIAGTGIQFTNFIVDLEYSYHFSELFKPLNLDGDKYNLGSKLNLLTLKVGFMF